LTLASSSPVPEPSPALITILLKELQALRASDPLTILLVRPHDERKRGFINSTVELLAYSLLAFRDVVRDSATGGFDAYLDGQIPSERE
jgi:hypothetical protein